ncbi:tyrosine-protein phosphatase [Flavobacterium cerinum]|uniref:protein-tyrosine-phosphatase n=1 Tax=Flavobacterium cerinum TaxID=2502784 RepID=A0ABY5IW16_9FLAO|nr:CpsB/CapC family capsule biosynthesis tyrosine phosphatase [Flavobacterium cerinum]UUC47033.1 histidinol phosphatase [Flavobacterium cerinum]
MLSFFKSKPHLEEIIPQGYIDIHSHLLFGIDDGAQTVEDTSYLLESCQKLGFSQMITTPHTCSSVWENTRKGIENKLDEVRQLLPEHSTSLNLKAASEYMLDDTFVKLFQNEKLLTLKDNYVLVEMSYINPPIQLFDILFELQVTGYQPVLAHPERYNFYHNNFEAYNKLKKAGCLFQANLLSTVGYYGEHVTKAVEKLFKNDMIDFTGSDIHHKNHIASFSKKIKVDEQPLVAAMKRNVFFQ